MSENVLLRIAQNVSLREGSEGVKAFFRVVYQNQGISTKETSRQLRMPIPIVAAIKQEAIKEGLIISGQTLRLSEQGLHFCQEGLGLKLQESIMCSNCDGLKYMIPKEFDEVVEKFNKIVASRPAVDVTIDQAHATVDTSIRRAILALEKGFLFNKKIAFLGDDDYISIATILLWQELYGTNGPDIVVFDIDQRILEHLESEADKLNYKIETVKYDARQELSSHYANQFDIVFTDPPYTVIGADLFLARSSQLLKNKMGMNLVFSFGQKAPFESWQVQERILNNGFIIDEMIPGFNKYLGAGILGNIGQLMILVKANTNILVKSSKDTNIYTRQK